MMAADEKDSSANPLSILQASLKCGARGNLQQHVRENKDAN